MSKPIKIDLRNLTLQHMVQADQGDDSCDYADPCIIGTLMTPEEREMWDDTIESLLEQGHVEMPEDQHKDAALLQKYFDGRNQFSGNRTRYLELASKYVAGMNQPSEG